MTLLKQVLGVFMTYCVALFALLFGGYLIYEKGLLSLQTGQTHERAGTVYRAVEPVVFWTSVTIYACAGFLLISAGIGLGLWITRLLVHKDHET